MLFPGWLGASGAPSASQVAGTIDACCCAQLFNLVSLVLQIYITLSCKHASFSRNYILVPESSESCPF